MIGEFAAEISAKQPDIVLSGIETDPAWHALMLEDPRIEAALVSYHVLHSEPGITVYRRNGAGRPAEAAAP